MARREEFADRGHLRLSTGVAVGTCAAAILLFMIASYGAALTKSATYDEPLHAVAGFVHRTMGDFRMNSEDPALFGYWGSLPHSRSSLKIVTGDVYWNRMVEDVAGNETDFVWKTLYDTPGNDGDGFVQRSRFMFVLVGGALGAVIACWSWQLGGAWAAVIATLLFAMDPNFLAHAPLVKNDVMLSLLTVALAMGLWRFGRRGTWWSLAAVAVTVAAALNVKFSAVLFGPIMLLALLIRALLPQEWHVVGRPLAVRWKRLLVAPAVCLVVALVSYVAIWGCYRFRFTPTQDPNVLLDTPGIVELVRVNRTTAAILRGERGAQQDFSSHDELQAPGKLADLIVHAIDRRLLPQAWLHGLLRTHAMTLIRTSYLLGEVRVTGWWYYFPCAMLMKTPTATLAAMVVSLAGIILASMPRGRGPSVRSAHAVETGSGCDPWSVACLALPVAIYLSGAMSASINLGLRHVLPVYPFLFVALGVALARILAWRSRMGAIVVGAIVLGLFLESAAAYPNCLAFFNAPSGGWRGGLKLLGDSNLDWGQDLKLLARWQRDHHDKRLFLAYFGSADPSTYGVEATHVEAALGGWPYATATEAPRPPCYLAVSATTLQGIYVDDPEAKAFYQHLQERVPIAVLGGSIYVYDLPSRSGEQP